MMLLEVMQGTLASVTRPGAPLDSLARWFSSPQSWHGTHRLITGMLGSPLLPLLFIVLGFLIDLIDISTEAMLAIVLRE
jgi:hypothetical protein